MKRFILFIMKILIAAILTVIQSCEAKGGDEGNGCEDVNCTKVFEHISLKLAYPNGQPVLLDSSKVFRVNENRYLEQDPVSWNEGRVWGIYTVVNDGMRKELQNKEEIMRFTGYLNGEIVCERDVLVGADCCHVNYLGKESLTQEIPFFEERGECADVACTKIYMHIYLKLAYPNGQPVLLDSSKVFWINENRYLKQDPVSWNEARVWGCYTIVNDGMQKELKNKEEIMHFTGYLNGTIVCERDVLVGADCCHVNYFGTESLTQIISL